MLKERIAFACLTAALAIGAISVAAIATASSPDAKDPADAGAEETATAPRYGFEVILAPAGIPGSYRMEATVRDLGVGKIVATPRIILSAGEPGRVEEAIEGRDHRAVVDIQIAEDQHTAEIVFQVVADHRSLTFARTTITLPGA